MIVIADTADAFSNGVEYWLKQKDKDAIELWLVIENSGNYNNGIGNSPRIILVMPNPKSNSKRYNHTKWKCLLIAILTIICNSIYSQPSSNEGLSLMVK